VAKGKMGILTVASELDEMGIDLPDKELAGLSLGDEVQITVKGTICSLSVPEVYEDGDEYPGRARVKISSQKVKSLNEFEKMAEEY